LAVGNVENNQMGKWKQIANAAARGRPSDSIGAEPRLFLGHVIKRMTTDRLASNLSQAVAARQMGRDAIFKST
jgi:hypothetical protein